ncbi:MAG: hypothetical protein ACI4VS_01085 [Candidatus Nanosyncoccaceae bacterium]
MSISSRTFELPSESTETITEAERTDLIEKQLEAQMREAEMTVDYESMKDEAEYVSPKEASPEVLDKIQARKVYRRRGGVLARIAQLM